MAGNKTPLKTDSQNSHRSQSNIVVRNIPMTIQNTFTREDILSILPHRPPFLFVDRVLKCVPDRRIIAERDLLPEEPHFAGHFPGQPIMPGVLVTDALAQTSGLLWGFSKIMKHNDPNSEPQFFYLASATMKYLNPAIPGETLHLIAETKQVYGQLHLYTVEATCGRRLIAKGTLTLAMKKGPL
jgi:3-hydroxymyristoyl/3-hydroxydecanoyl-(acyl carrier protein) dehydratase